MIFKITDLSGYTTFVVIEGIGDADPHEILSRIVEKYVQLRRKGPDRSRDDLLYDVKDWLRYTYELTCYWVDEKHIDVINEM